MVEKLTPRVGDRVLVIRGFDSRVPYTKCGWVRGFTEYGGPLVDIDGVPERVMVPLPHCQVVDREPVEWPEGWDTPDGFAVPTLRVDMTCYMSRDMFYRIRGPEGDYVADHMDELMGES